MAKAGKRLNKAWEAIDRGTHYQVTDAVKLVKEHAGAKFDETIELSMNLGVDPRHADQMVRGTVQLPNGTGKSVRVAVFAKDDKADEARAIVAGCRASMNTIEDKFRDVPAAERPKCLRLMSTDAMVIGGRSFQSDMIKRAGGINIFGDIDKDYPTVSLEDVEAKDPDIIIFNRDNEQEAIAKFLAEPGWNELRAAKEGRMMSISCDYICHPNTRIDKTVEMLARGIYPDPYRDY